MSPLLITVGLAIAVWAIRRIWRMPVRVLRAADVEAMAWEQAGQAANTPASPGQPSPRGFQGLRQIGGLATSVNL